MSDKDIVCTHELTVRIEQMEDGSVNWFVQPDEQVRKTGEAGFNELAGSGAPLAALAIKSLWNLLSENMVVLALEQANGYMWKRMFFRQMQQPACEGEDIEGTVVSSSVEAGTVH